MQIVRPFFKTEFILFRPPAAKVTGVVEESPGPLEYEVGLYREAKSGRQDTGNEVVVEQAVPIGTKLQLRASINTDSGKTNFILNFSEFI